MRVLHVIAAARRGGAEQLLWLTGRNLVTLGVDVSVLFFEDGPLRAGFDDAGMSTHVLGGSARLQLRAPGGALRLLRDVDPHLVHVHGVRALFHVAPVARAMRRPVIFSSHSVSTVKDAEYGAFGFGYRRIEGVLCRALAQAVVVTSERMRADLVARSGVPDTLMTVIPPCIDLDRLSVSSPEVRVAARYRFHVDGEVVGMIGRLIPPKGHAVMLRALALLPGVTLLVAGDGPERAPLKALAASLGVENRVVMLGDTSDVAAVCHASDVVVYPSTHGIIGLAALEAMACGVPVIASRQPGVTEFIAPGDTGVLVSPGDAEALATAVRALLASPETAAVFGQAGMRSARHRYSPAASGASHLALYDRLLGTRAASAR